MFLQGVINLSVQVQNYLKAVAELQRTIGKVATSKIISESLFVFVTGNNDISEYVSDTTLQQQYSADQYIALMLSKIAADIQVSYVKVYMIERIMRRPTRNSFERGPCCCSRY